MSLNSFFSIPRWIYACTRPTR